MSASRRLALLQWAHDSKSWIVEDDYDSYFRYRGRPLPALQRLESDWLAARPDASADGRVLYVGTFSKTMFPSLRLGYCIVPSELAPVFANARAIADRNSPIADQAALEIFIKEGYYDRHLRRIRAACLERYDA
jgi:GntR family transcriptional regulator/MocR family aminotransferase